MEEGLVLATGARGFEPIVTGRLCGRLGHVGGRAWRMKAAPFILCRKLGVKEEGPRDKMHP